MISFCDVYFHNITLCHFYALIIYWYGLYNFWKYLFVKIAARVLSPDHIVVTICPGPKTRANSFDKQVFPKFEYLCIDINRTSYLILSLSSTSSVGEPYVSMQNRCSVYVVFVFPPPFNFSFVHIYTVKSCPHTLSIKIFLYTAKILQFVKLLLKVNYMNKIV